MNISTVIPLALLLLASTAVAGDAPVPGKPDKLPWRLVVESERATLFVAVTDRSGVQANLASMIVFKNPVENDGLRYDAIAEDVAVYCPSKRYRIDDFQSALDGMQKPPPIMPSPPPLDGPAGPEAAFPLEPPPVDSLRREQLAIACGEAALPAQAIANPYRWARQRFGLETPPARKAR